MMKRQVLVGLLLVALAGFGALGYRLWSDGSLGARLAAWAGLPAGMNRRSQPTVTVGLGSVTQKIVATGRVEAVTEVTLANKIPGRIKAVLVKEGDPVRIGQPVILFDDQEYGAQERVAETRIATAEAEVIRAQRGLEAARAQWRETKSGARDQEIERARAEAEEARRKAAYADQEMRRQQTLFEAGYIARAQYDAAELDAQVARARVRMAEEALSLVLAGPKPETIETARARMQEAEAALRGARSRLAEAKAELEHARAILRTTIVESTVSGKVTRRLVEPGEAVDIGIPLMTLADVSKTVVKAEVDETDVSKLALGQSAEITAEAYPGRVFPGHVIELGQAVGRRKIRPEDPVKLQDMKVLGAKVEVTERGADLKLGMTVDVTIKGSHREQVVVLPQRLVPIGRRETTVVVRGVKGLESRRIVLGFRDEEQVEVVSGLAVGEHVLVRP